MTFVNKFPKSFPFDNLMLFELSNGDKEIRTPDPLLARQVLSQLSYTPIIWRPPTLPYRHQYSTIGRLRLNHRVRDGNGCVPQAHRHRKSLSHLNDWTVKQPLLISLERRWSSRTFRYGYLVTTSPQLSAPPSTAPSLRLGHWLRAYPTPMVWRAVCTRPGNVFTAAFWSAITSDSSFM